MLFLAKRFRCEVEVDEVKVEAMINNFRVTTNLTFLELPSGSFRVGVSVERRSGETTQISMSWNVMLSCAFSIWFRNSTLIGCDANTKDRAHWWWEREKIFIQIGLRKSILITQITHFQDVRSFFFLFFFWFINSLSTREWTWRDGWWGWRKVNWNFL